MKQTKKNPVYELNLPGAEPIPYTLRISGRASRISIRIRPSGDVELVIPRFTSKESAQSFLRQESHWVQENLRKMNLRKERTIRTERCFPESLELGLYGRNFPIRYEYLDCCWCAAKLVLESGVIEVSGAVLSPEQVRETLIRLIRRIAEQYLPQRLRDVAQNLGFEYKSVQIRMQKRRWGSCSGRGAISLNALLVLFPEALIDYVIVHELCHLREMNHSDRFWALVESFCPDARKRRAMLSYSGRRLPAYLWK